MAAKSNTFEGEVKAKLDHLSWVMYGLVIVLAIGFAGLFVGVGSMMIESLDRKSASYEDLQNEVQGMRDDMNDFFEAFEVVEEEQVSQPIGPIR